MDLELQRLEEGSVTDPMTDEDRQLLDEMQRRISGGMPTWGSVCDAWYTIRRRRLYREHHNSFADYCSTWGVPKTLAYEMADHGELIATLKRREPKSWIAEALGKFKPALPEPQNSTVIGRLSGNPERLGDDFSIPLPMDPKRGKALGRLPKPEREEAWAEAIALSDGNTPSLATVRQVVARRQEEPTSPLPFSPEEMESSAAGKVSAIRGLPAPTETDPSDSPLSAAELRRLQERFDRAHAELEREYVPYAKGIQFSFIEAVLQDGIERLERAQRLLFDEAVEAEKTGGPTPLIDRVLRLAGLE